MNLAAKVLWADEDDDTKVTVGDDQKEENDDDHGDVDVNGGVGVSG